VNGTVDEAISRRVRTVRLVVACSQRKRLPVRQEMHLSSIDSPPEERIGEWRDRLERSDAESERAESLYSGDHWHATREAFRLVREYADGAELWIISAGYGLIPAAKAIKPYSATFATRSADSVWRGAGDGDRRTSLSRWWAGLPHATSLFELLGRDDNQAVVIVASAPYIEAIDPELNDALRAPGGECVSVISAGTQRNGAFLPIDGRLREVVGGTDSALNARTLALLARDAHSHHFDRSAMAAALDAMRSRLSATPRLERVRLTDTEVLDRIRTMLLEAPGISRTNALRTLRASGEACGQSRFATLWDAARPTTTAST
jgi:hypothetical protein